MKAGAHLTHGEPALELFDQAVDLLRRAPARVHLVYLAGTGPFLLALLWFATDMSRGALADRRCAADAAGLAVLYLVMKTCHAVQASWLRQEVSLDPGRPWTAGRMLAAARVQGWIHPVLLLLAPAAVFPLLMIPVPWMLALAHGVVIEAGNGNGKPGTNGPGDGPAGGGTGPVLARAWRQARRWPGQLHAIVGLLIPLAFLAWVQAAVALVSGPWLLRTCLGVESEFTLSLAAVLNTTFLLAVTALAYLVLDPLVRAVFVLRSFQAGSVASGEDLRVRLRRARGAAPGSLALLFLLATASPRLPAAGDPGPAAARSLPAPAAPSSFGAARDLDLAIREVLDRAEYRWRAPREFTPAESGDDPGGGWIRGWQRRLDRLGRWVGEALEGSLRRLERWWRRFLNAPAPVTPAGSRLLLDWASGLQLLLGLLVAAAAGGLAWHLLRRRRPRPVILAGPPDAGPAAVPDLSVENVRADALPEEEWLALGRDLAARGEYRLAVRAAHLALLAHLARRERVRLATHKSNRDYARELRRHAAGRPELEQAFAAQTARFDRVWYGQHPAGAGEFEASERCLARLREILP